MIVYRIEDDFGGGPYNGVEAPKPNTYGWRAIVNDAPDGMNDRIHQPNPVDDLKIVLMDKHFKFGFASVDQMTNWFGDKARDYLREHRYRLAHYEVPDHLVITGGHQLAFDRRGAKLVKRDVIPAAKQAEMDFTKSSK